MKKYQSIIKWMIFIVCIAAPNVHAKKRPITLEQTVMANRVASSEISPDGQHIAYTLSVPRTVYVDTDGPSYGELHVTDKTGNSRKFITGKVNVGAISWSHDSKYIYYLSKRNDDEFSAVYRIAIDGGESEKMVTANSNITAYSLNHDTSKLVYLAKPKADPSEKELTEKGFKANVYEESVKKTEAWLVDLNSEEPKAEKIDIDDNVLSVDFHPTNNNLLVRATPTSLIDDAYTVSQYRVYNSNGKVLQSFKTEGKLGAASWSANGKYVAIIGSENKNDPSDGRLFIADANNGKLNEMAKGYYGHIRDIEWTSEHQVVFLGHVGTQSEVGVVNIDNGSINQKVDFGDVVINAIKTDASGKNIIGVGSSDSHPYEVFDLSTGKPKKLTDSNPWLQDVLMPKQETITYKARDGVELQGVLVYPQDYRKGRKYPLIMMVHGGPEAHISDGWLDSYSYPIKYATNNGFAVFLPNYRGSTGRGVEFSKMGQGDYAGAEFNDLVDAITHLSNQGLVDKKKVGITGGSYGGYASAWAATALSEHFAASVMFVGISNQLSKFGTTDIPVEMYNVHARYYPWEKWQWMLERSPIYHTDKAKTPILIMHGDSDTRVHPSQSMELYRYIKTRTETPVRLVFYPGEPHGNRKASAQLDYSMRLMRWMEFYLKGRNNSDKMPPYEIDHKAVLEKIKAKK